MNAGLLTSTGRIVRNLLMIRREFTDPLRSLLVGLAANTVDLDPARARLLEPLDAPFRNQCLALLVGVPGFNLEKAIELTPLCEPLRTQALILLASTPSLDVQSVFALYHFDEPFRSQCMTLLVKDPTLDVAQMRAVQPLHEPVRQQALAMVAGHPTLAVTATRLEVFARYRPEVPGHADVFFNDVLGVPEPILDDEVHLRGALEWLLRSQAVTGTGGFSAAYSFKDGWLAPYPETTGYIIPTLFDAHAVLGDARLRQSAIDAASWELEVQMPSGAIQAGYWGPDPAGFWSTEPVPAAFNTGQVVLGWNRAFQETGESRFLEASVRACRFLVECVDDCGIFRGGLSPGPTNPTRAYYSRVAYAMAWTGRLASEPIFEQVARRHLNWVMLQLQPDGWFLHAGFDDQDRPLTHTMAYTAEGLLYAGEILGDDGYIEASRRHALAAADTCERRRFFLAATYSSGWKSTDRFCCVPGNAQFAGLWLKHGGRTGDLTLVNSGLKMVEWLEERQSLDSVEPGIRGGLPAASPIDGGYSTYSYVNWAVKYFIDALLEARVARQGLADAR